MKHRDSKLEDLLQELEQKGQAVAGCNLKIRTLEEALIAKEQIKVEHMLRIPELLECYK
jgi:hypothetical protein